MDKLPAKTEFSLMLGGPLYRFYLRTHLARPPLELLRRRIATAVLLTWVPLAALSLWEGTFLGGGGVPFLFDLEAHVRFLLALPLLIGAEPDVNSQLEGVVRQFKYRGLVAPEENAVFESCIFRAMRLADSLLAELGFLAFAFLSSYWLWRYHVGGGTASWYGTATPSGFHLNGAGYWYECISLPIARFVLLRWYFRQIIWYLFLTRVSRLALRLNPLHPDRAAGLGFLAISVFAFARVLVAQTILLSGFVANRLWHEGTQLKAYRFEIVSGLAFLLAFNLLPLAFFSRQMLYAKWDAIEEHGLLASRYVNEFRGKWWREPLPAEAPLLGNNDIQALADMGNSYNAVFEMGSLPVHRSVILQLAALITLPLLPLFLFEMPVEEILRNLTKVLF